EKEHRIDAIILAYGLCGNGLIGIRAGQCPLILPRAHDCISILLGGIVPHATILKENPATYFYSPGWIRGKRVPGPDREAHLRATYATRYADDPEMIDDLVEADQEVFAHHNCAAYVDITDNAEAENYCQGCAHHLNWEFRRIPGDATLLQDLIDGHWDATRYLTVPPGQTIALSGDSKLICARL
ncbi:MAG: DUF1638 domain-containing protein, partial [Puniceicoccaceae bacterium]